MPGYRLAQFLRDLRQQSGSPNYRAMADRLTPLGSLWRSGSTLSRAASGHPVKDRNVVAAYLTALGHEPDSRVWTIAEELWRQSRHRLPTPDPGSAATMGDLGRLVEEVIRNAWRHLDSSGSRPFRSTIHGITTGKWLLTRNQLRKILDAAGMPADQIDDWVGCRDRLFRASPRADLAERRRRRAHMDQRIFVEWEATWTP
jgi:hypothetical protein